MNVFVPLCVCLCVCVCVCVCVCARVCVDKMNQILTRLLQSGSSEIDLMRKGSSKRQILCVGGCVCVYVCVSSMR